jgi:hypothetical protein
MKKNGQSTVEYILLVTVVVGVIILLTTGTQAPFKKALTNTINMSMNGMQTMAARLTNMTP